MEEAICASCGHLNRTMLCSDGNYQVCINKDCELKGRALRWDSSIIQVECTWSVSL